LPDEVEELFDVVADLFVVGVFSVFEQLIVLTRGHDRSGCERLDEGEYFFGEGEVESLFVPLLRFFLLLVGAQRFVVFACGLVEYGESVFDELFGVFDGFGLHLSRLYKHLVFRDSERHSEQIQRCDERVVYEIANLSYVVREGHGGFDSVFDWVGAFFGRFFGLQGFLYLLQRALQLLFWLSAAYQQFRRSQHRFQRKLDLVLRVQIVHVRTHALHSGAQLTHRLYKELVQQHPAHIPYVRPMSADGHGEHELGVDHSVAQCVGTVVLGFQEHHLLFESVQRTGQVHRLVRGGSVDRFVRVSAQVVQRVRNSLFGRRGGEFQDDARLFSPGNLFVLDLLLHLSFEKKSRMHFRIKHPVQFRQQTPVV
jgi:hypothetical protein